MSGVRNLRRCGSVLVTGASRGLGLQLVHSLAAAGGDSPGKVIATCRDPSKAKELQELAAKHPDIHMVTLDVLSQASIEKCAEEVGRLVKDGGLNCLINNAGINLMADFHVVTAEMMMENFKCNTVAPLMITKAFLPLLKQAAGRGAAGSSGSMGIHRAAVINISSSLASLELNWGETSQNLKLYPYRASKSALNMLTRSMAMDLEPDGILCMALHPGWVRTDMGGSQAPLSPEASVSSMLSVIGDLTEKDNGSFLDFNGKVIPW